MTQSTVRGLTFLISVSCALAGGISGCASGPSLSPSLTCRMGSEGTFAEAFPNRNLYLDTSQQKALKVCPLTFTDPNFAFTDATVELAGTCGWLGEFGNCVPINQLSRIELFRSRNGGSVENLTAATQDFRFQADPNRPPDKRIFVQRPVRLIGIAPGSSTISVRDSLVATAFHNEFLNSASVRTSRGWSIIVGAIDTTRRQVLGDLNPVVGTNASFRALTRWGAAGYVFDWSVGGVGIVSSDSTIVFSATTPTTVRLVTRTTGDGLADTVTLHIAPTLSLGVQGPQQLNGFTAATWEAVSYVVPSHLVSFYWLLTDPQGTPLADGVGPAFSPPAGAWSGHQQVVVKLSGTAAGYRSALAELTVQVGGDQFIRTKASVIRP